MLILHPSKKPKDVAKAKKLIKGLTLQWEDINPLDERNVVNTTIGHTNPIMRLCAREIVASHANMIFAQMRFTWLINITLFFKYPNGDKYQEDVELEANCYLKDLNAHCLTEITATKRLHAENAYQFTAFKIQCVGV